MKPAVGVLLCSVLVSSCYTLTPVAGTSPLLGETIAITITDAGRVALGESMGPEIGQIEGRLVNKDNTEYVVAVTTVRFIRGGEQTWTGEKVRVRNEFVSTVLEKKFSRGRTALISGAALGVVAVLVTRAIIGSGNVDPLKSPVDTTAQTNRIPWH